MSEPNAAVTLEHGIGARPAWGVLAAALLMLNATCLFSFTAVAAGWPIASFGLGTILILGALALVNWSQTAWVLRDPWFLALGALTFGLPVLGLFFGNGFDPRAYALRVLYMLIVAYAYLAAVNGGLHALRRILVLCWAISAVGMVASVVAPEAFLYVALANDGTIEYAGRAYGFFMQPNDAATNLILMMVTGLAIFDARRTSTLVTVCAITFASVLATGSRSGSAICLAVACLAAFAWQKRSARAAHQLSLTTRLVRLAVVAAIAVVAVWGIQRAFEATIGSGGGDLDVGSRIQSIADADTSQISTDFSVLSRLAAQARYLQLIAQRPLTGYGLGAGDTLKEQGIIDLHSHNQFLEAALDAGVFGAVAALLIVMVPVLGGRAVALHQAIGGPAGWVAVGAFVLLFMVSNTVLTTRMVYFLLGGLLGLSRLAQRLPAAAAR